MKYNVSFSQIVDRLVVVLNNTELTAQYQEDSECYEGVCGWCGVMAPLTRLAFIKEFGRECVELAELDARRIIQEKAEEYRRTAYYAHTLQADQHKAAGMPVPAEGDFVWAVSSCLKGECGYGHELRFLVEYQDGHEHGPRLCCVEKVIQVDELPMNGQDCDALVPAHELHGGNRSDDVPDDYEGKPWNMPKELVETFYTIAAVVVDKAGRWYMVDAEGYDYCRYFYSPLNYSQIFESEISAINQQIADEKAAAKKAADEAAAKRLAEYNEKCQKWAPFMEPVEKYEKAVSAAWDKYVAAGMKRKSAEEKAHSAAERQLTACRRRNILAMAQAAFPGVKFSLHKEKGWGADWDLTWQDGPTEEEFEAATNMELFATYGDRFNGMEDYSYTEKYEFTDFAKKFMGNQTKEVDARRYMSSETKAAIMARIAELLPHEGENIGDSLKFNNDLANDLAKHLGVGYDKLFHGEYHFDTNLFYTCRENLAYRVFKNTSYFVAPETPVTPDPTNGPKNNRKAVSEVENGENVAPVAGLHLVEIEGGVAVVGDEWKDTYFHKREIKAHGATWNKAAKQWQATEPDAVAQLREWFGQSAPVADEQQEQAQESATAETEPVIESENIQAPESQDDFQARMLRHNYGLNLDAFYDLKKRHGLKSNIILFRYADHCECYGHDAVIAAPKLNRKPVAPTDKYEGSVIFYGLWIDQDQIYQAEDIFCNAGLQVIYTDGRLMDVEKTEAA